MSAIISLTKIKRLLYSLQWKFVVAYLLIIIIAFGIVAVSVIQLVGEYLFNQRVREEERIAEDAAQQIAPLYARFAADEMYALALSVCDSYDARVLLVDLNGVVQVDSHSRLNGRVLRLSQAANALKGEGGDYGYYQSLDSRLSSNPDGAGDGAMTGVYACPVRDTNGVTGALIYISAAQDIYDGLRQVTAELAYLLLAVSAVVGLLSVIIARLFTRPVSELGAGIRQMSKGDFSVRVRARGKNEFSDLARAFNSMSQRMETLDRSRNQFVSNASHELKTPLSTMKILLQTLMYQEVYDPVMSKEFLGDIDKEIDRLSAVVGDLLTLVSIDSGEMRMNPQNVSLRELIHDNVRRLAPLARERGIELEFAAKENIETVGDQMKLTQVFYNLIDNAIKYTPRGGSVRVEMTRQGKTCVARVSDNGIGIPEADQLHVFDRFYRVDKARSRDTGGTGLGLSIVKQIVLMHGGSIGVASEENIGTTFTVELPIISKQSGGKNL